LNLLEESQAKGLPVYATFYPYDFWGSEVQIPLFQFLYLRPEMAGWNYYKDASRLEDVQALIRKRLQEYGGGDKIEITRVRSKELKDSLGETLKDLALKRKMSEEALVLSLLLENGTDLKICYHGLSEEGMIKKIQSPFVLFGSDSTGSIPHPRDVGSFPRLIGSYVRDKRIIRLSEAVHRLTQEPAKLLGLKDRGLLKTGYWGDVVVFDAKTIRDKATAVSPWSPPDGIQTVLVNGQVVFEKDSFSGKYPGQVLRRSNN
jgi:N-acyl-D-amino-acid deacylase